METVPDNQRRCIIMYIYAKQPTLYRSTTLKRPMGENFAAAHRVRVPARGYRLGAHTRMKAGSWIELDYFKAAFWCDLWKLAVVTMKLSAFVFFVTLPVWIGLWFMCVI